MSMSLESQCLWRVLIEAEATTRARDTDMSMSLASQCLKLLNYATSIVDMEDIRYTVRKGRYSDKQTTKRSFPIPALM